MNPAPRVDYVYLPKGFGNKGCYDSCIKYMYYIYATNLITGGAG